MHLTLGMSAVHFSLWSSQWGFKARHRAVGHSSASWSEQHLTSRHLPCELKADNVQITGFMASFLSWFCCLFFSPEMKRNEIIVPIKHLFFISSVLSGASLWCVNYSTLQRTVFGTQECYKRIILRWLVFLLLGYHGGCVVMRGGNSFGRWEVKNCSDFKAMSLCKTPIKVWEKTEFEGRWPFHPCYMDWESETGLASCFKVMSKLSAYSFGSCISPFFILF